MCKYLCILYTKCVFCLYFNIFSVIVSYELFQMSAKLFHFCYNSSIILFLFINKWVFVCCLPVFNIFPCVFASVSKENHIILNYRHCYGLQDNYNLRLPSVLLWYNYVLSCNSLNNMFPLSFIQHIQIPSHIHTIMCCIHTRVCRSKEL